MAAQHWSEAYIGRPYVRGVSDCAHLAASVSREVFGRTVPDDADVERAHSNLGRALQMKEGVGLYGEPTEAPEEGDIVLMLCCGRPSHVGIYCITNGEPSVLHAMQNAGMVVLHKIRQLDRVGLSVEGYYRWK